MDVDDEDRIQWPDPHTAMEADGGPDDDDVSRLLRGLDQSPFIAIQDRFLEIAKGVMAHNGEVTQKRMYNVFLRHIPAIVRDQPPIIVGAQEGIMVLTLTSVWLSHCRTKSDREMRPAGLDLLDLFDAEPEPGPSERTAMATLVSLGRHPLGPTECEHRLISYFFTVHCDIVYAVLDARTGARRSGGRLEGFTMGRFPLMVGSDLCCCSGVPAAVLPALGRDPADPGGYFISRGKRKIFIINEKPNMDVCRVVFQNNRIMTSSSVRSSERNAGGHQDPAAQWHDQEAGRGRRCNAVMAQVNSAPAMPFGVGSGSTLSLILEPAPRGGQSAGGVLRAIGSTDTCGLQKDSFVVRGTFHQVRAPVPIFGLFFALGAATFEECIAYILPDACDRSSLRPLLVASIVDAMETGMNEGTSVFEVLQRFINAKYGVGSEFLHRRQWDQNYRYINKLILNYLLPHIGTTADVNEAKLRYMGYITRQALLVVSRHRPVEVRDRCAQKQAMTVDRFLVHILHRALTDLKRHARVGLHRARTVEAVFRNGISTNVFTSCCAHVISTGNLPLTSVVGANHNFIFGSGGAQQGATTTGVVQMLNTTNRVATLSHLNRVCVTVDKNNCRNYKIRMLNTSQLHYLCMLESPEGASCGILHNLTLLGTVTPPASAGFSVRLGALLLAEMPPALCGPVHAHSVLLLVDGRPIGSMPPERLAEARAWLREARRAGRTGLAPDTSIAVTPCSDALQVVSSGGRFTHPFLVVEPDTGRPRVDRWSLLGRPLPELLRGGYLEWIDDAEAANCAIALSLKDLFAASPGTYTHATIHPCLMLGPTALVGGFQEHTSAPRNVVHCGMQKQSIRSVRLTGGDPAGQYGLMNPQTMLVPPLLAPPHEDPMHQMCLVAITNHGLQNMNDAYAVSKAALERGLFHTVFEYTRRIAVPVQQFQSACIVVAVGDMLSSTDTLFVNPPPPAVTSKPLHHLAVGNQHEGPSRVKRIDVLEFEGSDVADRPDVIWVIVTLVQQNVAGIGDKIVLGSSSAAKGVLAQPIPASDLPFLGDGTVPDVLLNPHSVLGRLTIGILFEMLCGKARLVDRGGPRDAGWTRTAFGERGVEEWMATLRRHGADPFALETMYDGLSGEALDQPIAFGPLPVSVLTHLVSKKIYSRGGDGPQNKLFRSPCEGRKSQGGLRLGEQETSLMVRHGLNASLRAFLPYQSDASRCIVCTHCQCLMSMEGERAVCPVRADGGSACRPVWLALPFATIVLLHELASMGVRLDLSAAGQPV